jgi:predicted cupin superfamily sugar epimerase
MPDVEEILWLLDLKAHPIEGGFYRETYRSRRVLPGRTDPGGSEKRRAACTAIYYLLTPDEVSALHRLEGDEIFHFYLGDPVEMLQLHPDGAGEIFVLGADLAAGMRPQVCVPGGTWQGSRLAPGGRFALLGTTMAPGFDPADYEQGEAGALSREYPAFRERILELARSRP